MEHSLDWPSQPAQAPEFAWSLACRTGLEYFETLVQMLRVSCSPTTETAFLWYLGATTDGATQLLLYQDQHRQRVQQLRVPSQPGRDPAQLELPGPRPTPTEVANVATPRTQSETSYYAQASGFEALPDGPQTSPLLTALGARRVVGVWLHDNAGRRLAALGVADPEAGTQYLWSLLAPHHRRAELEVRGIASIPSNTTASTPASDEDQLQRERELLNRVLPMHARATTSALVGSLAHEFNNILMSIMGYASLARRDFEEGMGVIGHLTEIENAGNRTARLVRQLRTYTRALDQYTPNCDVNELVSEVLSLLRHSPSKGVRLQCQLDDGLPPVAVSPADLRHLLVLLVNNARESYGNRSPHGPSRPGSSVIVHTRLATAEDLNTTDWQLDPRAADGRRYLLLEVTDDGVGVQGDVHPRLFDPCFSTKSETRGLGLAMAREITLRAEGAIGLARRMDAGTSVRTLLPLSDEHSLRNRPRAYDRGSQILERELGQAESPTSSYFCLSDFVDLERRGFTVLLVDDDAALRDTTRSSLETLGIDVILAVDGQHGVETLEAHRQEIDCVLLDLDMPRMDGGTALQKMRAIDPEIMVIIISGSDCQTRLKGGPQPDAIVRKPFQVDSLDRALGHIIYRRKTRRGPVRGSLSEIEFGEARPPKTQR